MAKRIVGQRLFEIYIHRNKHNGKAYIGQTALGMRSRWHSHKSLMRNGSQLPFHRALRRYGVNAFDSQVLAVSWSYEDACEVEKQLIASYKTFGRSGYNATKGGEGSRGMRLSHSRRKEISRQFRELVRTPEHCARISDALRGRVPISAVMAAAQAKRGTQQDLVTRAKSLESLALALKQWGGCNHTNESKAAMRRAKSRDIEMRWPDGRVELRKTTLGAISEEFGISAPALSASIKHQRPIRYKSSLRGCVLRWK